jgi:FkbM family methyltransferase
MDAAYRVYRQYRELHKRTITMTSWGFLFGGHQAMQNGSFEFEEAKLVRRYLERASVFVDVGSNLGYFTCIARQIGKYVIAVEPCNQNLDFFYMNIHANGWKDVEVFPVGLGEKPGLNTLYGWGTGASMIRRWAGCSDSQQRTVPISTLDIVLGDRFGGEKIVIKVDVEGLEYLVLRGAQRTLKRCPSPVWLVEVCLTENQPAGINPHFQDVFRIFWEQGYQAKTIGKDSKVVTQYDVERWVKEGRRDFGYVNYVFERA